MIGRVVWSLVARQLRHISRLPSVWLLANLQPIVWLVFFSQLFTPVSQLRGFGEESYLHFLTPGIVVMSALYTAIYSGLGILADMQSGMFELLLAAPIPRFVLLVGFIASVGVQVLVQSVAILLIAGIIGGHPPTNPLSVTMVLLAAALIAVALSAVSALIALTTRRQQSLITIVNVFALPLTFLSTTMMSSSLMPNWMHEVARINPVDWAVSLARAGFESRLDEVLVPVILLTIVSASALALAGRALYRFE